MQVIASVLDRQGRQRTRQQGDEHERDLIIMAVTSQVRQPPGFGETMLPDWQAGRIIDAFLSKAS